jgi:hypothetical protein
MGLRDGEKVTMRALIAQTVSNRGQAPPGEKLAVID